MFSFEGQTRARPVINLGGGSHASGSSAGSSSGGNINGRLGNGQPPLSIAERARQERQQREELRRLDRYARVIQGFYRSRKIAGVVRDSQRAQYDSLLSSLVSPIDPKIALEATVRLAYSFRPENKQDAIRLGKWARTMATGKPTIGLWQSFDSISTQGSPEDLQRWKMALIKLSRAMCKVSGIQPTSPSIPLYLELVKQLLDPSKYASRSSSVQSFPSQLAESLVSKGVLQDLRKHLLSFGPSPKPSSPSIAPSIAIAQSLLLRTKGRPTYADSLRTFTSSILTIPNLTSKSPARLPVTSLAALTGEKSLVPLFDILQYISEQKDVSADRTHSVQSGLEAASLLANLLEMSKARMKSFPGGKEVANFLGALEVCLRSIPVTLLATTEEKADSKGKSRATAIDLSTDGDDEMADSAMPSSAQQDSTKLDSATSRSVTYLASEPFLSALISLSTRYSASSRPALSSFLVCLLYSWPSRKEAIINSLVYSGLAGAGKGLLREIWRGWVRSSALARQLSDGRQTATTSTLQEVATVGQPQGGASTKYAADWPHFVLLAELYARSLLTLGDDEFFAPPAAASSGTTRNPLTIDEVVGLSALWRNLAFALYWQPEVLKNQQGEDAKVPGTRVTLEQLRKLGTTLLQAIHARDSRRQFTPTNHWIMTSQMDLTSFIESAIIEDRQLDDEENAATAPTRRINADDSDDDELPRPQAMVRRNLPSRRQMAFLSPRLGVLNNIPFVIPFEVRVSIFQQFIYNDREKLGLTFGGGNGSFRPRFQVGTDGRRVAAAATVRRGHIADDGFRTLSGLGSQLKERLAIRFIDEYGQEEAGIDGGGLFKEFLTSLTKEAFDIDRGLWLESPSRELYPAANSYSRESFSLQWYAFLGRIMGKALYEGILVDVPFAPFFLSKWLGRSSGFDDLASYDPELYQGMVQLKNYTGDVEKDLSLNFAITDDDFGVSRTIELVPNGSNIPVTNENRISYIYRVSDYRLNKQIEKQCSAFFSGLSDLIDPKWLRMFNQVELALLVGGAETSIDIDDLRHNTIYSRGFDESHPSIQYFWTVVNGFSQSDKKALVKFITSCPRPPLLGFGQLNPKFAIGNGGGDESRLPSASTCVNLLKLPVYSSPELLKQKLLASIHSGAGFDLS